MKMLPEPHVIKTRQERGYCGKLEQWWGPPFCPRLGQGSLGRRDWEERRTGRAEGKAGSGSLSGVVEGLQHRLEPRVLGSPWPHWTLVVLPQGARWRLRVCSDIYRAHTWARLGLGAESKVVGRTETLGECSAWGKHRVLGVPGQALTIKWALRRLPGGSRCLGRAWNG